METEAPELQRCFSGGRVPRAADPQPLPRQKRHLRLNKLGFRAHKATYLKSSVSVPTEGCGKGFRDSGFFGFQGLGFTAVGFRALGFRPRRALGFQGSRLQGFRV